MGHERNGWRERGSWEEERKRSPGALCFLTYTSFHSHLVSVLSLLLPDCFVSFLPFLFLLVALSLSISGPPVPCTCHRARPFDKSREGQTEFCRTRQSLNIWLPVSPGALLYTIASPWESLSVTLATCLSSGWLPFRLSVYAYLFVCIFLTVCWRQIQLRALKQLEKSSLSPLLTRFPTSLCSK